ncbi:MAG: AMP-binding protein [Parasporobacterium sp.]|nr:AMP-binding protein [Parasporobacterium sp.]
MDEFELKAAYVNPETATDPITAATPWEPFLGSLPFHLDYYNGTLYEGVKAAAERFPNYIAFDFMGRSTTYKKMLGEIQRCARSLKTLGIREGDHVTIALPNCPQAIFAFYALNCIGAVANMVHPLSAEKELEFYINISNSITVITLDQFYNKIEAIRQNTKLVNVVIASIKDELSKPVKAGYMLTEGRKVKKIPKDAPVIRWNEFMNIGKACFWDYEVSKDANDTAVILYSGGTTGTTKGIELSNRNFNALAAQIVGVNPMFMAGDRMLAAMPVFHGFGLGVCIHSMLFNGGRCILIPRFTPKSYAKQITKYKCNFIAGVPTLYEALLRLDSMEKADLSSLKGVFSGGDSLSIELKKKFDKFLYDHHASIQVREGYGTTETVTACCLTPPTMHKEGSIGVPFPDTFIKIVRPGTDEELPYGEEGEILLAGPTVMKGYMNNEEETANTLRKHSDGLTWVYTGDLGCMDQEGFVYFKGRAKRMIISSGYNVYPAQMENILDGNEMVHMSCVIGLPDSYKMQKVKAFVVLKPGYEPSDENWLKLMAYCKKHVAKYAMPCDIVFRDSLPTTLVGKVAYRILEEEELAKLAAMTEEEKNAVDPGTARKEEIARMAASLEEDDIPVMEGAQED